MEDGVSTRTGAVAGPAEAGMPDHCLTRPTFARAFPTDRDDGLRLSSNESRSGASFFLHRHRHRP